MEAYTLSMKAVYLIEKELWQEALDDLMRSKLLYTKISHFRDSLEAALFQEKIG